MEIEKIHFGITNSKKTIFKFILRNSQGMEAVLTNYGAILTNLFIPINNDKLDVVLGYDDLESYISNPKFFGAVIGPNCNRINGGEFSLNNKKYTLEQNDNNNNLHSGERGLHKSIWNYLINEDENYVEFTCFNVDKEQGFPGNSRIRVRYTLTDKNELQISYNATSDEDTIMNLTNHTYFNLAGHKDKHATKQKLWINAQHFTPVKDNKAIPTGEIKSVKETVMDFTQLKTISTNIEENDCQLLYVGGYDHNFVINKQHDGIEKIAKLINEDTNILMEVYTDLEGVQFYSGNSISGGPIGKENTIYENRSAICLETQYFPDAINNENFTSPILKAGDNYGSTTIYKFSNQIV